MSNNDDALAGCGLVTVGCGLIIGWVIAGALFLGWLIMLIQGALAPTFDWETWSFGTSVLIGLAVSVLASLFKGGK